MKIKINPIFGKEFELLIQENDKIKTLKTIIKEKLNFNSECQIIFQKFLIFILIYNSLNLLLKYHIIRMEVINGEENSHN